MICSSWDFKPDASFPAQKEPFSQSFLDVTSEKKSSAILLNVFSDIECVFQIMCMLRKVRWRKNKSNIHTTAESYNTFWTEMLSVVLFLPGQMSHILMVWTKKQVKCVFVGMSTINRALRDWAGTFSPGYRHSDGVCKAGSQCTKDEELHRPLIIGGDVLGSALYLCVRVCEGAETQTNLLYIVLTTSGEHLPIHVFASWPQGPLEGDETPLMHISPRHSDAKTEIMKERMCRQRTKTHLLV